MGRIVPDARHSHRVLVVTVDMNCHRYDREFLTNRRYGLALQILEGRLPVFHQGVESHTRRPRSTRELDVFLQEDFFCPAVVALPPPLQLDLDLDLILWKRIQDQAHKLDSSWLRHRWVTPSPSSHASTRQLRQSYVSPPPT